MKSNSLIVALCLMVISPTFADSKKITAISYCAITPFNLMIRTIIEAKYTKQDVDGIDKDFLESKVYWNINCTIETGECSGVTLKLNNIEMGKPIDRADTISASGMRLASLNGKVATVSWGNSLITVDLAQRLVLFRSSAEGIEGAGTGSCGAH